MQSGEKVELPPTLLMHGAADKGVPQGLVENGAALSRGAGGEVDLALFKDMPHGIAGWTVPDKFLGRVDEIDLILTNHR